MGCVCDENTTGIVDGIVTCGNIVGKYDEGIIATGINVGMVVCGSEADINDDVVTGGIVAVWNVSPTREAPSCACCCAWVSCCVMSKLDTDEVPV